MSRAFAQLAALAARAEPLIAWYERFKPAVRTLTVSRADYHVARSCPHHGRALGFTYLDGEVFFRGFKLKPDTGEDACGSTSTTTPEDQPAADTPRASSG